ncbi:ATP-dependent helicase [Geobacter anodireducens]|uniref:DNA 3'-5' helicase n=1 Tax=Geobacter soli TaxID=1510391 RepID=A0A0C1TQH1_9BACT|nr:UvrD-helicase domain-containing protein [Geobacter soli]KIE43004.1 ATP-dependent DNA helicase Rep [Geobacter soli]
MLDLSTLNPPQREAVDCTEGPLLVLAGAGSGKTRVITCRIGHLVLHRKVAPESILAVTFTNKAAGEMKERVRELVGRGRTKGMIVSTFHSLGVRILRRDIERLGYKRNFGIYTTSDQLGLVRQALREVSDDGRKVDTEGILWRISGWKNRLIPPDRVQPRLNDPDELLAATIYPRYQRLLMACNAIDFDDIIMLTVRLLQEQPEVLDHWQERFRYIMVDEYQDTNASQYLFVSLLAKKYRNLCVVGDDDQSIYGWRGADVGNILAFEKDYPGCRVVKLEQNYRSTGTILEAANHVIRNNSVRTEKRLWTDAGEGRPIDLVIAQDDEEEATQVVERLQMERYRHNLSFGDFAILYRTNSQSRAFEEQLRFEDIPYVLVGGMQFYERKEVKDALSYLKVIDNPRDEQSLLRIVNFPRRGIGDGTVLKINQWSLEHDCPLLEAFGRVEEIEGVTGAVREKVLAFHRLVEESVRDFRHAGNLPGRVKGLFDRLGLEEELYRTIEDPATARRKVENVAEVINSLASFEERIPGATLSGFLEKVSLMDEDRFAGKDKKEHGRDAVTLMSLHSSKGLEFPCVFLVGFEEEILPHKRTVEEGMPIDEERRLCYVGITRARRHLTITRCLNRKKYGKLQERQPSRFLEEIPGRLLQVHEGSVKKASTQEEAEALAQDFFARMRSMLQQE